MSRLTERLAAARETAYDWHGGQSSPLYSFASTGVVHGAEHRAAILAELAESDGAAEDDEAVAAFNALRRYIESIVF